MQTKIPCVLMRGGTSKGPFFNMQDLPSDPVLRDRVLLRIMGSPDVRQIDGIGGATSVTSKTAIISRADHPWAQIDYLFAQVAINEAVVDTSPSCGNILSAVAPYAIEQGLVPATNGETRVRIRNVNTNALIEAVVQTPDGCVTYEGDTSLSGVPGTGSPITLHLRNIVGSKTGKLLPTGNSRDVVNGVNVSCVDVAMPMVFVPASEMGKTGYESKAELDSDKDFLERLEQLRCAAAHLMGMGDVQGSVVPKIALVAEPQHKGQLASRYFTPKTAHPSYAVLGSICAATAATLADTVVRDVAHLAGDEIVVIEHPAGTIEAGIKITMMDDQPQVTASIIRTARRLLEGYVYIPGNI
ncbi:MAG: 4-oxalomesaconate tautomerase [Anaerolineae bacterium]|nr:4-oxalomesaconate tautomerase [Anaerolineae bacterium]